MAGKNRSNSSDELYDIIKRGTFRQSIFETEAAKDAFEYVLRAACEPSDWSAMSSCIQSGLLVGGFEGLSLPAGDDT